MICRHLSVKRLTESGVHKSVATNVMQIIRATDLHVLAKGKNIPSLKSSVKVYTKKKNVLVIKDGINRKTVKITDFCITLT